MKKFFTAISKQSQADFHAIVYQWENQRQCSQQRGRYPIVPMLEQQALEQEQVLVVAVAYEHPNTLVNLALLKQELARVRHSKNLAMQLQVLWVKDKERRGDHEQLFSRLIVHIQPYDQLYGCITYGNKPFSMVLFSALYYGCSMKENTQVQQLVYGRYDHSGDKRSGILYDMSGLFYLHEMIGALAYMDDGEQVIGGLLELTEER